MKTRILKWMMTAAAASVLFVGGCGAQTELPAEMSAGAQNVQENGAQSVQENGAQSVQDAGNAPETAGDLTVTFLDVGQGNAVLVESAGEYMLIDGGDREYSSFVVSYLKNAGVTELSYVISSHYDADHLNGVVGALNAFPCETVLAADYVTDTRVYDSFCEAVAEQGIPLVYPSVGDVYEFGDAEFTVVCPDSYDYADVNDDSVGIRLVHGDNSFLICGDAGKASEEAMLESGVLLDSDVYLASHHGSDGSSGAEFLEAVSPETVVISVGEDNSYGHPSERVLADAAAAGAEIYRTDLQGTVTVTSDGKQMLWNTEPAAESGQSGNDGESTYILNQNTKKFHLPSCASAEDIGSENRAEFRGSREELTEAGYEPCQRCKP